MEKITSVYQPSIFDLEYFKPEQILDNDIIIIGNPEKHHNVDRLDDFLEQFRDASIFALDSETFGKVGWHALYFRFNYIRTLQIGLESGLVLIIDFGGWYEQSQWTAIKEDTDVVRTLELLSEKCFDNTVAILGVNLSFDFNNIRHHFGIISRQARDLRIISQVLWAGVGVLKAGKGENRSERCKLPHSLIGIAERYGVEVDKSEQVSAWGWKLTNSQLNYAAKDVRVLFELFYYLKKDIIEHDVLNTAFIECNCVGVFSNMEYLGMPVNLQVANEVLSEYKAQREELLIVFQNHFPDVQYTSNPQVLEAFKDKWPDLVEDSVSKDVLSAIGHESTESLLKLRQLDTDIAYIEGVIENTFNDSVRCLFTQIAGSGSGRSSCKGALTVKRKKYVIGAQLQNPSKNFRHIFQHKNPEKYGLGIYDSSGSHLRIATEYSEDPLLIKIFSEGFDGHAILASDISYLTGDNYSPEYIMELKEKKDLAEEGAYELSEKEKKDIKKALKIFRNLAKTLVYSSLNGAGVYTMLKAIHKIGMSWATEEDAKKIRDLFYSRYPNLIGVIKGGPKEASKFRFTFTNFKDHSGNPIEGEWGLIKTIGDRHVYMRLEEGMYGKQVPFNDAVSALWLSTEANMMKEWMYKVQNKFWETPEWETNIVHMAHDEIVFVYNKDYTEEIGEFVVSKMNEVFSKYITIIPALEDKILKDPCDGMKTDWSEK